MNPNNPNNTVNTNPNLPEAGGTPPVENPTNPIPVVQAPLGENLAEVTPNPEPVIQSTTEVPPEEPVIQSASEVPEGEHQTMNVNPSTLERPSDMNLSTMSTGRVAKEVKMPEKEKDAVVPENLKKVEVEYKPPSKFRNFLLGFLFVGLIIFVVFLPEFTEMIEKYQQGDIDIENEKITTGKMSCTLSSSTTYLDKDYDYEFEFKDNKLRKAEFTTTTRGDVTLDETTLDDLAAKCKQLNENVEKIEGVSVRCKYVEGRLTETQTFDLEKVDQTQLDAAFAESGGTLPGYQFGQDMDFLERNMKAAGYDCNRTK